MTSSPSIKRAPRVLSIVLAAVFIVSAVAKLFSIDQFELYVYSFGLFSLNVTFILARLCIGIELALGIMLLTGWQQRIVLSAMLAMLLFFSLFLCYAALRGRTDSCQCFGQLADMPPAISLLKNAVLIVLTLLALKIQKEPAWLVAVLAVAALAAPFVISVPDSWMFGTSHERYNAEALGEALEQTNNQAIKQSVVAFVTPGCPYCRMTRQKLDSMAERNNLPENAIIYIEPKDIGDNLFLAVTYGARPLVLLLMDGDSVIATYHYRNIKERQIVKTLKGETRNEK